MTLNEQKLYQSLERIVSYYDALERGEGGPSVERQSQGKHENTMFGEARRVLKEVKEARIVGSRAGNIMPDARMPESSDKPNSGTGAD